MVKENKLSKKEYDRLVKILHRRLWRRSQRPMLQAVKNKLLYMPVIVLYPHDTLIVRYDRYIDFEVEIEVPGYKIKYPAGLRWLRWFSKL